MNLLVLKKIGLFTTPVQTPKLEMAKVEMLYCLLYFCYCREFPRWWICHVHSFNYNRQQQLIHAQNKWGHQMPKPSTLTGKPVQRSFTKYSRHIRVRPATCIYFWHVVLLGVPGYETNSEIWSFKTDRLSHRKPDS